MKTEALAKTLGLLLVMVGGLAARAEEASQGRASLGDWEAGAQDSEALMASSRYPWPRIPIRRCPGVDLIVTSIADPEWEASTHSSVITFTVRNTGASGTADRVFVMLDDGRSQVYGRTPAMAAGESRTLTLRLPYSVYQPDAHFRVSVDPVQKIEECNEKNNFRDFISIG